MCLLALAVAFSFAACDNGEEVDTNLYKGGVSLNSFGPCPVARGGELRFLGSGMDKVQSVSIPGCGEITDLKVVSEGELRLTVPQNAEPGKIVLKTPTGEITTKTPISYSEPIGLENLSPNPVKPGSVLAIKGEYLNLIQEVIFPENVIVAKADFISQSRKEIQLAVPVEAQTGKIIISDTSSEDKEAIPNWIYSDVLDITLPSVEAPSDLTGKKPGDEIVVKGQDLDLVLTIRMPNGEEVEFVYAKNEEGEETLTFTLPENASDGAVVMIPASGVEVAIANIGMALPADVVATPAEELRAGDVITLTGINMELVTSVTFPGVEEAVIPDAQSATAVKVTMPAAAISGELQLNTASGASVPVAIATQKPEFMAFASEAVSLGADVVIKGKNLDLVVKVIYAGGAEVEVTPESATEFTVVMPTVGTESGALTLVMANGETVETGNLTINAPEFCYIPVLPGEDEELKGGEIFTITVENGKKLTGVQVDGKDVQFIINGNTLVIAVPQMANAKSKVKLISSNGSIEYGIAFIPATEIKNEVWSGLTDITWSEGGRVIIPASAFDNVPEGARMVLHYAQKDQVWAQAQINYGDFSGIDFTEGDIKVKQTLVPTDVYGWFDDGVLNRSTALVLTGEILDNIQAKKKECEGVADAGIVIQGSDLIFSSVTLEWTISLETTVWKGEQVTSWDAFEIGTENMFIDLGLTPGQVMRLYFKDLGAEPKVKVYDGHWNQITTGATLAEDMYEPDENGVVGIALSDAEVGLLTTIANWGCGMMVMGQDCTLTKVTIE